MPNLTDLLGRRCDVASGTKVINCVAHSTLKLTERPPDCRLCSVDIQNTMRDAIAINEWLNEWKQEAIELLKLECVAKAIQDYFAR